MQGLAVALGVEQQKAQWWHALFLLEHTLGDRQLSGAMKGAAGEAVAANATLELCMCQDVDIIQYAAQLLYELHETMPASRLIQQCCHGTLRPADHCLSV